MTNAAGLRDEFGLHLLTPQLLLHVFLSEKDSAAYQILQRLHGEDDNTAELLENALLFAKKRVVVKRPIQAATVSEKKPNTCIKSKKTRYDIYTIEKM